MQSVDLTVLTAYLWTTTDEIPMIKQVLERLCVNPLQEKLREIETLARDSYDEFTANVDVSSTKALIKLRGELVRLYGLLTRFMADAPDQDSQALIIAAIDRLEVLSQTAHGRVNFTYAPLHELEKLQ